MGRDDGGGRWGVGGVMRMVGGERWWGVWGGGEGGDGEGGVGRGVMRVGGELMKRVGCRRGNW